MKIEIVDPKVKCDASGCDNLGEYRIVNKRFVFYGSYYFCKKCLSELYNMVGELIIPKSPQPIFKKKGVKNEQTD